MDGRQGNGKNGGSLPRQEAVAPVGGKSTRGRKPYQKPAFQFEHVFETQALSCGKTATTEGMCHSNRSAS